MQLNLEMILKFVDTESAEVQNYGKQKKYGKNIAMEKQMDVFIREKTIKNKYILY